MINEVVEPVKNDNKEDKKEEDNIKETDKRLRINCSSKYFLSSFLYLRI